MRTIFVALGGVCIWLASATASECDSISNCKTCAANANCQYCSSTFNLNVPVLASGKVHAFGICVDASTDCSSVTFGTLDRLGLNIPGVASIKYSVEKLAESDPFCTTGDIPRVSATPDCNTCVQTAGAGWCEGGVTGIGDGGVCIPKGVGFLCNKDMVPKLPVPFSFLTFNAQFVTTADGCSFSNPTPPPAPSATCTENLSGSTCTGSSSVCTWCAGVYNTNVKHIKATGNLFGVCLDGDVTCDNINFGTIEPVMNQDPDVFKFGVQKIAKGDELASNTVQWPREAASPSCADCVKLTTDDGWCELETNVPTVGFLQAAAAKSVKGGICMTHAESFLCTVQAMSGALKSHYAKTCTA